MELPIAQQSYNPSAEALVRAVKRSAVVLGRTQAPERALGASATVIAQPGRASVMEANFAAEVRLEDGQEPGALLDEIDASFAEAGSRCLRLWSADEPCPPALAQAAQARGYRSVDRRVLLLQNYRPPGQRNDKLQIIPARAAYAQLRQLHRDEALQDRTDDAASAGQWADMWIDWLDEPRLELFLGRYENRPVAVAGVLTLGQMGVLRCVFVHGAFRGRGFARTLLDHVIDHCTRAQFQQVLIERPAGCPSLPFYQHAGFEDVAGLHSLER